MIVMNSVTFTPIAGAKVLVNAEELTSDAEGKVKLDKCVDDKVMVSTDVTDFCASPSTEIVLQPDDNARIFLVKPKGGNVTLLTMTSCQGESKVTLLVRGQCQCEGCQHLWTTCWR